MTNDEILIWFEEAGLEVLECVVHSVDVMEVLLVKSMAKMAYSFVLVKIDRRIHPMCNICDFSVSNHTRKYVTDLGSLEEVIKVVRRMLT